MAKPKKAVAKKAPTKKAPVKFILSTLCLMVVVIVVTLNFTLIKDLLTCLAYRPSEEMIKIREDLSLINI